MTNTDKKWDSIYRKYYDRNRPISYRGYFGDDLKDQQVTKLLKITEVKHIVVGHTSQKQVETLFKNKIFAVDTSIKKGVSGQLLFIENNSFYRGMMDGEKIKIEK